MSLSKNPTRYRGVRAILPPDLQKATRAPTSADSKYVAGTLWLDTTANASYMYPGSSDWIILGSATGAVGTLTGDTGGALSPTAGNISILGGDGIGVAGSGSTLTITDTGKAQTDITFTQNPVLQAIATTGVAPVGTDTVTNIMCCQEGEIMEVLNIGTQTIIAPRMAATGLLVSLDLTDNEGCEYNWGTRSNSKHSYTIGTSAAFYVEWRFTLADVTGCDPVGMGFRKQEANNAVLEDYTDMAWIGVSQTDTTAVISLKTQLNDAATTTTNTTDAWTDGQTHTLKVLVSAAGVVTYTIDGAAPTTTAAFTFDDADVVMPFFHGVHGTTTPGAWHWVWTKAGLQ